MLTKTKSVVNSLLNKPRVKRFIFAGLMLTLAAASLAPNSVGGGG